MAGMIIQKRNNNKSSFDDTTAGSCSVVAETVGSFASRTAEDDFCSPNIVEETGWECRQKQERTNSSSVRGSRRMICNRRLYFHLCLLGIVAGMVVSGISYCALEMLRAKFYSTSSGDADDESNKNEENALLLYMLLIVLSRLRDIGYALMCLGGVWTIATSSGNTWAQRGLLSLAQVTRGDRSTSSPTDYSILLGNDEDGGVDDDAESGGGTSFMHSGGSIHSSSGAVFVAVIIAQEGFSLGTSLVDGIFVLDDPRAVARTGVQVVFDLFLRALLIFLLNYCSYIREPNF